MDKHLHSKLNKTIDAVNEIIFGKETAVQLALCCLLSRGHLLIEDLPGVGKTTLAHVIAQLLGLKFNRIQFTSDMLPADVLGISIYEQNSSRFTFHPGPIFTNVVLADEINRATPKAQSALLEAMEERQVTIEGETRLLPAPFFVIATQNPVEHIGTYPLPESQLDRFLMSISLGYPDRDAERLLLTSSDRRDELQNLVATIDLESLLTLQQQVMQVTTSEALIDYIQAILQFSRESQNFVCGLSPRAGLALLHASKAWALLENRDYVIPEDVQAVLPAVTHHRLINIEHDAAQRPQDKLLSVAIP
ncbi:FIG022979: MoxR-like ATPases [hydrothermal vent metagenome]|uniref:FIG022979: MoxR-like ATPases n=1 Tax=hydrothermal vent metagenome TaxID=652676 RepID=A0A3B1AMX2_9ZZZZ